MELRDLERYLERGDVLGFVNETSDDRSLGWILLNKLKPHDRFLSVLEPGERPEFQAEQESIRMKPYHVVVIELKRDAYEDERYETNDDYILNEQYDFQSLDDVEVFVQGFGKTLRSIKWASEIGSP